ncbi:MAG TPA: hypothetical protein VFP21_11300 [Solirubrobacterales bacterium]|nr:hypothetical protein [Solirubrobacterales bacterium]
MEASATQAKRLHSALAIGSAVVVVLATTLLFAAPVLSSPVATQSMGKGGGYARDCVGAANLSRRYPQAFRFIVWCGVQAGKVRFSVRQAEGGQLLSYPRQAHPEASGAAGSFRCRKVVETLECAGRVDGPVVVRGFVEVPDGARCRRVLVETAGIRRGGRPTGCPGTHAERPPHDWAYMREFRQGFGLDLDLGGDRAAIDRRIRDLVQAWVSGNPVARVTAAELGLPLSARDQVELEYRDEYRERDSTAIERWAARHAKDSFAGWDFDHESGGIFYIGFVGDQEARIAEFERQVKVLAPERIKPFPTPPRYSERELAAFEEKLLELGVGSELLRLVNGIGTNYLANRVEVGTEHVAKVRRRLAERFGPENPALVVFEEPGVLL